MDYAKIAPSLASAFGDFERGGRPALRPHVRTLGLVSVEPVPRPPRVVAFLHCDEDADLGVVADYGVELNQGGGAIRTAIVPLESLDRLSGEPAVRRIVAAQRLRPLMDVAPGAVGVPAFRQGRGLSGSGVVIGIVDTGIEPLHPAFAGRILRLWDQTLSGPGVGEGGYGVELSGPLLQISRDTVGHGTHVAGIAAGDDPTYGGIAPGADLIVVKSELLTAHIADAVRYVFRVAGELGRPAVVNLSLGGHGDAHDGTDSLSAVIDASSGPGRIVCCAAGNEGNDDIHAQVEVAAGKVRSVSLAVPRPAPGQAPLVAVLNGWYSGADRLEVAVASPGGIQTPFQPVFSEESPVRTHELAGGIVRLTTPGPDPANGDHNFLVEIVPAPASAEAGTPGAWRLRLRGTAAGETCRVDVWSLDERTAQFTGRPVQDSMKVGAPGAASLAVTVGSYTTKVEWIDIFGNLHQAGHELGDISEFSSEGPRRDGAPKPDVVAPGAMIAAALSAHSPVRPELLVDALNIVSQGTSMACPFVAGLVALLLERDPDLEPAALADLLRSHSSVPGRPPGTFDPKWGYGLISAEGL
jgi:subtilisin family serine protease